MPNHPAMIDPFIIMSYIMKRFQIRPVATAQQVKRSPRMFGAVDTLVVPDFDLGVNSYQKHCMEKVYGLTLEALESGDSVLLYPAGRLMRDGTPFSEIGASAAFEIISRRRSEKPWRVVLVSTHGLWGSRFSFAYNRKKTPDFFGGLRSGICDLLCNLILFMPKRVIDIHMECVDITLLVKDKHGLNACLHQWYEVNHGGEKLIKPGDNGYVKGKGLVPRKCCSSESIMEPDAGASDRVAEIGEVDPKVAASVQASLAKHLGVPVEKVGLDQDLSYDLGMDSIQLGELLGWLDLEFDAQDVEVSELSNVASVVCIATGQRSTHKPLGGARTTSPKGWDDAGTQRQTLLKELKSQNVPSAFVYNAKRMGSAVAVGDSGSGAVTYSRALVAAMLFADFLRAHPERVAEDRIGLMMPAAAGAGIIVMGILMAGLTPVMVNWTVGRASLEHVIKTTGITTVITARALLEKVGPEVDLSSLLEIDGMLLFVEDLKANKFGGFGGLRKATAMLRSKKSATALDRCYGLDKISPAKEAVVLFTSGSESLPKGVQLTHRNILSNIGGMLEIAEARTTDCLFGVLPPFHSFGFTVTTVGPLVSGVKAAYYRNPTEYRRIAHEIQRFKPTIFLGTPTFVNGVLQAAQVELKRKSSRSIPSVAIQIGKASSNKVVPVAPDVPLESPWPTCSLRLLITGAEKTPADLFRLAATHEPELQIVEGYGITETGPVLTSNLPDRPPAGVGWAIRDTRLALLETEAYLNKTYEVVASCHNGRVEGQVGKRGVIAAHGPGVFGDPTASPQRGYLGISLSEKNPFVNINGKWWYDTGDLGFFDKDGALHLAGRLKRFVKVAGEMISLPALEGALKSYAQQDGIRPWQDGESGPVLAVEAYEADGQRPILGLIAATPISLDEANQRLQAAGMPKIAKLTVSVDVSDAFDSRWAEQGTVPLLGTGKTDYVSIKKALAAAVVAKSP